MHYMFGTVMENEKLRVLEGMQRSLAHLQITLDERREKLRKTPDAFHRSGAEPLETPKHDRASSEETKSRPPNPESPNDPWQQRNVKMAKVMERVARYHSSGDSKPSVQHISFKPEWNELDSSIPQHLVPMYSEILDDMFVSVPSKWLEKQKAHRDDISTPAVQTRQKTKESSNKFKESVDKAYCKLVDHADRVTASPGLRDFAQSWSGVGEIVETGAAALDNLVNNQSVPSNLREAYSLLHVAYGLSQSDLIDRPQEGLDEFRKGLKLMKSCIRATDQRDIFDELAAIMADEFECALTWMRKNQLEAYLNSFHFGSSAGRTVAHWLRIAGIKEALLSGNLGKEPPRYLDPKTLYWDSITQHSMECPSIVDFADTTIYKGVQRFLYCLKGTALALLGFCQQSYPLICQSRQAIQGIGLHESCSISRKRFSSPCEDTLHGSVAAKKCCIAASRNLIPRSGSETPAIQGPEIHSHQLRTPPQTPPNVYSNTTSKANPLVLLAQPPQLPQIQTSKPRKLRPQIGHLVCGIDDCPKRFTQRANLLRHQRAQHPTDGGPGTPVYCRFCSHKRGGSRARENIRTHEREEHSQLLAELAVASFLQFR